MVNQFTQTQVLGQRDRKEQPSIGHQAAVVEGDLDAVGMVKWCICWVLLVSGRFGLCKTIIPEAGALSYPFSTPLLLSLRWIGAKARIHLCDFSNPDDAFSKFLLSWPSSSSSSSSA